MKVVNTTYCHLEFVEYCEISKIQKRQVFKFLRYYVTCKIALIVKSNYTLQLVLDDPSDLVL